MKPILTITHPDTVSGMTIMDDGSKMYWTEGRCATVTIINQTGQIVTLPHDAPEVPQVPGDEPMRPMVPAEVREYDSILNSSGPDTPEEEPARRLVVLCKAIDGDGTINTYSGPDTPAVRAAVDALDEKHGPDMFQIVDSPCECDTAEELLETLDWWGGGCPD